MSTLTLYKVYCTSESAYKNVWSLTVPTICPDDGGAIQQFFTKSLASFSIASDCIVSKNSGDSPYTAGEEISIDCDTSSGDITVNLPTAVGISEKVYHILKSDASNTVTIDPNGSETISGSSTLTLTFNGEQITIRSDGTNWTDNSEDIIVANASNQYLRLVENIGAGVGISSQQFNYTVKMKSLQSLNSSLTISNNTDTIDFAVTNSSEAYRVYNSQTTGTNGGTATSGAWTTLVLNTLTSIGGSNVALASNEFTLQPGNWTLIAQQPFYRTDISQIRLYDVTGSNAICYGTAANSENTNNISTVVSILYTTFTVSTATDYRIEYYASTTRSGTGLGLAIGTGSEEIWTQVLLTKL